MPSTPLDRPNFVAKLAAWIDDPAILTAARQLLQPGPTAPDEGSARSRANLGDRQIANWRARARTDAQAGPEPRMLLPETLVEGAALAFCALGGQPEPHRTGMAGKRFFQVFVVSEEPDKHTGRFDAKVLRYWQSVAATDETRPRYLTHKTWFDGEASPAVVDLADPEAPTLPELLEHDESQLSAGSVDRGFRKLAKSSLAVTWTVGAAPRDYGYEMDLEGTVEAEQIEYLGGIPTIPVESAHLIAYIPRGLLATDYLGQPQPPQCFATLVDGDPTSYIQGYARGNRKDDIYHSDPYAGDEGWAKKLADAPPRPDIPAALKQRLPDAGRREVFVARIDQPLPYLMYVLVFGRPPRGSTPRPETKTG